MARLLKFHDGLKHVEEYHHNPLPPLCAQAVHLIFWGFVVFGALAMQPICVEVHPVQQLLEAAYPWTAVQSQISCSDNKGLAYLFFVSEKKDCDWSADFSADKKCGFKA